MFTVSLQRLGVVRACAARSWCWIREPSWASTSSGTSVGRLGHEEDADALGPDQPHGLGDRVEERLRRVGEQQVRLVEEEHQLGLVRRRRPRAGRGTGRPAATSGTSRTPPAGPAGSAARPARSTPAAVGGRCAAGRAVSNSGSPKNASAPWSENAISSRRITPAVRRDSPPRSLRSALPSSRGEELHHRAQVGEVEQRQAGLVGVVEDQPERRLLGLVEAEHLGEQRRAERRHRDPQRDAGALAAEREELDREAGRRPVLADRRGPGRDLVVLGARRRRCPDRSPLMSAAKTGTPCAESCSASSCRVLVLPVPVAPATRPCRLSIASGIRTWTSASVVGVEHQAAELERRPLERVARPPPRRRSGSVRARRGARTGAAHARRWSRRDGASLARRGVIFKRVGDGRPYPDHELSPRDWAALRRARCASTSWSPPRTPSSSRPCSTRTSNT